MSLAISTGGAAPQIGALLWQVLYALFMFGLVVLLCVLVVRLWVRKGNPVAAVRGRSMRMLEFMPLGTGKGLYLLRVPEAIWLVGVTEHGISVLKEYPATMDLAEVMAANSPLQLPDWLARVWPKRREHAKSVETEERLPGTAFSQELLRRIEQLKEPTE